MRQTELAKLAARLREMAAAPKVPDNGRLYRHSDGRYTWTQAAAAVTQLARHEVEGGIRMKCGHPVQCAYPEKDVGTGCSMCDLVDQVVELSRQLTNTKKELDEHYIGGK